MKRTMKTVYKLLLACLFAVININIYAQELNVGDIELKWGHSLHEGRYVVTSIKNNTDFVVIVTFTNEYAGAPQSKSVAPHQTRSIDITCNIVTARPLEGDNTIFLLNNPRPTGNLKTNDTDDKTTPPTTPPSEKKRDTPAPKEIKKTPSTSKSSYSSDQIIADFVESLESIPFLSYSSLKDEESTIKTHISNLQNWKDREEYIRQKQLVSYTNAIKDSINIYRGNSPKLIFEHLNNYDNNENVNKDLCYDSIQAIINARLELREANINLLSNEINKNQVQEPTEWDWFNWWVICIGILLLLLLASLLFWFLKVRKEKKTTALATNIPNETADPSSAIVVRRKTTTILKKQSLEDVIDNDAYLKIDCADFCEDSAVRRMYIKNTCIKDIYNMYAEDLRDPDRPKEDGCMVLGRWVYDKESKEYYVSLEHIILPGDDAVFAEYELNFGGKIKLKYKEKLRKLRRETNLQYDLTCWVHSHPGLKVFFSNSDYNVQMQLKDPIHPHFLTAIVIDILTPKQDLGIFTFKHDSSVNSINDLKKLYSLEEMYQWAVESERNTFKPENYYDTLSNSESHDNDCYGIELSNGAIIDMGMLTSEQETGLVGMAHGFCTVQGDKAEYVVATISKNESVPDNELVGCFLIASHCSIPTIRRAVSRYMGKIKFVLVYTTTDGMLTSIPVVNQDICTDDKYYGEQKLEDLKIWTRRRR